MMDPKDVGEWQHEEFYRYVAQAHDKPRYTCTTGRMHLSTSVASSMCQK